MYLFTMPLYQRIASQIKLSKYYTNGSFCAITGMVAKSSFQIILNIRSRTSYWSANMESFILPSILESQPQNFKDFSNINIPKKHNFGRSQLLPTSKD